MRTRLPCVLFFALLIGAGCGPGGGGDDDDDDDGGSTIDSAIIDAPIDGLEPDAIDASVDAASIDGQICDDLTCTTPVTDNCVAAEICNNGTDDNCNDQVDEGCLCTSGAVQACFRGQPGRRNVGSCVDGMQTCIGSGE